MEGMVADMGDTVAVMADTGGAEAIVDMVGAEAMAE